MSIISYSAYAHKCVKNDSSVNLVVAFKATGCGGVVNSQTDGIGALNHDGSSPTNQDYNATIAVVCKNKALEPDQSTCYSYGGLQTNREVAVIYYRENNGQIAGSNNYLLYFVTHGEEKSHDSCCDFTEANNVGTLSCSSASDC